MKSSRLFFWLSLIIFFLFDQFTKFLVIKNLYEGQSIPVIKGIFHITLVRNTGLAFGLLKGTDQLIWIFTSLVILSIIVAYYFLKKPQGFSINFALGLICAGAIGNVTDRLIYGKVIDFLDFRFWPVFNIADSSVVIGVVLIIFIYTLFHEKLPL